MFQSLFSWNSLFDRGSNHRMARIYGFQSLFSWNSLFDITTISQNSQPGSRFNPCFPGTRSSTAFSRGCKISPRGVSILVFLELALRPQEAELGILMRILHVSILVFLELALRREIRWNADSGCPVSILVFLELALRRDR